MRNTSRNALTKAETPDAARRRAPSGYVLVMGLDLGIGLGTAPLASTADGPLWWGPQARDESVATVQAAVAAGATFIDTAPFYGWGLAEDIVGDAIADLAERPPILTKCGTVRRADGTAADDASPDAIRADVEASLVRLGLDHVDVVQIHDPDPATDIERSWERLMGLRDEGLIGGAGLSNHPVALMERAAAVGPVAVVQHQYSLLHRRPEHDGTLAWCRDNDVPFLAWAPLASGFLTDGFDLSTLAADDLRTRLVWATGADDVTQRVRAALADVADEAGASMIDVAIAWTVRRPDVGAIIGARSPHEATVCGSSPLRLAPDAVERLDAALDG